MNVSHLNWKIGGRAGEGIAATSFLMAKICQRAGLSVFEYGEYPSLIRGGHTTGQVSAATHPVTCQKKQIDFMVILNEETIRLHLDEFCEDTLFLIDTQDDKVDFSKYPAIPQANIISVPMVAIARETTGKSLASNMVSLAVTSSIFGLPNETVFAVIRDFFQKKGEAVINENIAAATKGFEWAVTNINEEWKRTIQIPEKKEQQLLLTGTEAIGFGALSAGVQYYSAYPMTPSSALMTFMADAQGTYPLVLKHAEDEIAAINNALGASFAGARVMTGTAGGGFALMVEAVSLAGVTELPLVCMVGGRPGPATGLPTWTSQTDLSFVMYAGHGEFPKVVFTPGNIEESFKMTRLAFIIAEKYHTQVYIIADKLLLESRMTSSMLPAEFTNQRYSFAYGNLPEDNSYRRFEITEQGHSPRSIPGQPHGLQLTNSYEHDQFGYATEDGKMTKDMVEKRMRKLAGIIKEVPCPQVIGPAEAGKTLVCWGSTRLAVEEVIRQVNQDGQANVNAIHILTMLPFHAHEFSALAQHAKKLIMIEENIMRQAELHIKQETGITFEHRINRYDGRPFYAEEIIEELKKI